MADRSEINRNLLLLEFAPKARTRAEGASSCFLFKTIIKKNYHLNWNSVFLIELISFPNIL